MRVERAASRPGVERGEARPLVAEHSLTGLEKVSVSPRSGRRRDTGRRGREELREGAVPGTS